jgi:Polyketide cyclase / dehydrase and lipid transport
VSGGASVRKEIRIHRRPADVWARIEDPGCIQDWFPGIVASTVDGTTRVITLGSGLAMPEEIVTSDPILRRFQYRITVPIFHNHLGTIDVIDLHDDTSLVVYSTDADPRTMALVIGAATAGALVELRDQMEVGQMESEQFEPAQTEMGDH